MKVQTETGLSQVYELLEAGNPGWAKPLIEDALAQDLENEEIIFVLRCINFWSDKIPVPTPANFVDQEGRCESGENLLYQWKQFLSFAGEGAATYERAMRAVYRGVFTAALECFELALNTPQGPQKSDLYRQAGLCCKKLGQYETALGQLTVANSLSQDRPEILAEMADCYALCGNDRHAKMLFREAFFLDPSKIDGSWLDSEMIRCLMVQVEKEGYGGAVLMEWVPIYGTLYGVFTIKRELKGYEAGKLRQGIFSLENALKETGNDRGLLVPRLINHYFWLIDYFLARQEERPKIEETLLKIKLLDGEVHKKYTGIQE
jgi:tetratricopeptide (TPR) repeat protein